MFAHNISELFYNKTLSTESVDDTEWLSASCEPACSLALSKNGEGMSGVTSQVCFFFQDDLKSKCFEVLDHVCWL